MESRQTNPETIRYFIILTTPPEYYYWVLPESIPTE
jgi:hypothetical protein